MNYSLSSSMRLLSLIAMCLACSVNADAQTPDGERKADKEERAKGDTPTAKKKIETVSTAEAGAAGANATRGAAGEKRLERWTRLLKASNGRELTRELAVFLTSKTRFDPKGGFAVLYDWFRHLDERPAVAALLANDYNVAFAMTHLAMLNEDETAAFSHYLLTATWDDPRSYSRRLIYDSVSLVVSFHPGRYPDFESALRRDIDEKLRAKEGYLPTYFSALGRLRYSPDITVLRELLHTSTGRDVTSRVLQHLGERDDRDSALTVIAFLRPRQDLKVPDCRLALEALCAMKGPEAVRAMEGYLSGRNRLHVEPAWRAYLTETREVEDLTPLRVWLDSSESDKRKLVLLRHIGMKNRDVLRRLASDPDPSWPERVRRRLPELAEPSIRRIPRTR